MADAFASMMALIAEREQMLRDVAFEDAMGTGRHLAAIVPGGPERADYITVHAANRVIGYPLQRVDRTDDQPDRFVNVALVRARLRRFALTELNHGAYRLDLPDGGHAWVRAASVRPCSANVGGDPASGCEIPAMANRDVCWWHARAEAAMGGAA